MLESALFALVKCVSRLEAAEVWQADDGGRIRCTIRLTAGGDFCRPNQRVDGLLHGNDLDEFWLGMTGIKGEAPPKPNYAGQEQAGPKDMVLEPRRTPGILASPFRDLSRKVGKSWIGADRHARGFALVLRINASVGPGNVDTVVSSKRRVTGGSPRRAEPTRTTSTAIPDNINVEDGKFVAAVAREVEVALACTRGREQRAELRALALKRVSAVCSKKIVTRQQANDAVLAEISVTLRGCRAYIGVLQPGGNSLLYEAATPNSNMLGKILYRGEGISFACLDTPGETIRVVQHRPSMPIPNPGPPRPSSMVDDAAESRRLAIVGGTEVDVWYATSWLSSTIVRCRGHECYDVRYEGFGEIEAGVPRWRIREVVMLDHLDVKVFSEPDSCDGVDEGNTPPGGGKNCSSWPWPFVCVPLRCGGNKIGVLGIDGWGKVKLGRIEERHPEKPVVRFLKEVGAMLATAHYTERRNRSLSTLGALFLGEHTSEKSAIETLIVLLREAITFRRRIDVLEMRAAEPGTVYYRGTWCEYDCVTEDRRGPAVGDGSGSVTDGLQYETRSTPVKIFETGDDAPREEQLCVTPSQVSELSKRRAESTRSNASARELSKYQEEVHLILRDGPNASSGLQATELDSRPGEIVCRFQRLTVRPGAGRPRADGWYLVRIARTLPQVLPTKQGRGHQACTNAARNTKSHKSRNDAEIGDLTLLSDMCRQVEVGLMAIAGREQRAGVRLKALDRVFTCCRFRFGEAAYSSETAILIDSAMAAIRGSPPAGGTSSDSASAATESGSSTVISAEVHQVVAPAVPIPEKSSTINRTLKARKHQATAAMAAASYSAGAGHHPTDTAIPLSSAESAGPAPAVTAITKQDSSECLMFSAAIPPPTSAETPDGRKGALVTLKDDRLAVLVQHGERRVAAVEQPGGKQQMLAETEVGVE